MKKGVSLLLLLFSLVALVIFSGRASAVGLLYPSDYFKLSVPYEAGGTYTLEYHVKTNAGKTIDYELSAVGDFSQYVAFDPPRLKNVPDSSIVPFKAVIHFPDSYSEPGPHPLKIFVTEASTRGSGGSVGIATSSYHTVTIFVPYPDLYAELSLGAPSVNSYEPVHFLARAKNLGERDIAEASLTLSIYDSSYELVDVLSSGPVSIQSQSSHDFELLWNTSDAAPGEYFASAVLDYDGRNASSKARFRIGTLRVTLLNYSNTIAKGGIRPINLFVRNDWNDRVSVYAELSFSWPGSSGSQMIRTPPVELSPFGTGTLVAYWNTDEVKESELPVSVSGKGLLQFSALGEASRFSSEKSGEASLNISFKLIREAPAESSPATKSSVASGESAVSSENIMGARLSSLMTFSNLLILLIVLLILFDFYWMFKREKK